MESNCFALWLIIVNTGNWLIPKSLESINADFLPRRRMDIMQCPSAAAWRGGVSRLMLLWIAPAIEKCQHRVYHYAFFYHVCALELTNLINLATQRHHPYAFGWWWMWMAVWWWFAIASELDIGWRFGFLRVMRLSLAVQSGRGLIGSFSVL